MPRLRRYPCLGEVVTLRRNSMVAIRTLTTSTTATTTTTAFIARGYARRSKGAHVCVARRKTK